MMQAKYSFKILFRLVYHEFRFRYSEWVQAEDAGLMCKNVE